MTLITVSRQFGSGGDEIAHRVCDILGYHLFDKRLILHSAKEAGLSEHAISDYPEEDHKISTFLDRLFNMTGSVPWANIWHEAPIGYIPPEKECPSEEILTSLVQKAVFSAYRSGNMVILGRGGQVILKGYPGVFHIRIIAPVENRIQRVKQRIKESRGEFTADIDIRRDAQDLITERDAASRDYIQCFYHTDWDDPMLYHLILNTGLLTTAQAAEVIVGLVDIFEKEQAIA